jgi:hypothetical protein
VLYVCGFEEIGVVAGDLYFLDPNPGPGQEGAERGVRVEVRRLGRGELRGTIYSATPISIDEAIWRVDLFESVAGPVGSYDRTHHHPRFTGWDPGRRNFIPELSADPLGWLEGRLRDIDGVLRDGGVDPASVPEGDRRGIESSGAEIVAAVGRLLDGVRRGDLGVEPPGPPVDGLVRSGWL